MIESVLKSFIDPIETIDSGCPECINSFIDEVNETLKVYNFRYDYNQDSGKVKLIKT